MNIFWLIHILSSRYFNGYIQFFYLKDHILFTSFIIGICHYYRKCWNEHLHTMHRAYFLNLNIGVIIRSITDAPCRQGPLVFIREKFL